jgi:hypothetical protein
MGSGRHRPDAAAMDAVLILERWGSDRLRGPNVLAPRPHLLRAETGGSVGFQSLKRAMNPYDLPEGWGIIGTMSRRKRPDGVRALFAVPGARQRLALAVDRRDDRCRRTRRGWGITRRWALRTGAMQNGATGKRLCVTR